MKLPAAFPPKILYRVKFLGNIGVQAEFCAIIIADERDHEASAVIYTVTLNPSLHMTFDVEEFIYDEVNVIVKETRSAGGKGIEISRVIKELGGQSVAMGFMGGYNGLEVEGRLTNEGIICDFTRTNGETRTTIVIHQRKKKMETLLSASAAPISQFEVTTFYNKIKQIPRDSHVVLGGTIPPGLDDGFYAQIVTGMKHKNVKLFLDADGEALRKGVQAGPYLIKPNIHEFGRLVEKNVKNPEDVLQYAPSVLDKVDLLVVSMGARGALGISREEAFHVVPPKVNVKNSTGAGDVLLAGTLFALHEGASFRDALCLGVACGTASTLYSGSEHCLKEDVTALSGKECIIFLVMVVIL
jgi:6-phosphofructokinase 2